MVHACLSDYEAKQVLNIPLSFRLPEEKFIWHWEKDGEYSVRTAYRTMSDAKHRDLPSSSCNVREKLWGEIWKAQIPNKNQESLVEGVQEYLTH